MAEKIIQELRNHIQDLMSGPWYGITKDEYHSGRHHAIDSEIYWLEDLLKVYSEVPSPPGTPHLDVLAQRSERIELLERYSKWLEKQGYLDTDWRAEAPYAIDEFLKTL